MLKRISCRHCEAEIVLAETRAGYWKAIDPEPVYLHEAKELEYVGDTFIINKTTLHLVPLRDVACPPAKSYMLHRCIERPAFQVPLIDEPGIVKVGEAAETDYWANALEVAEVMQRVKEARKARELLTESEPTNAPTN
jgi:hypothetical protein